VAELKITWIKSGIGYRDGHARTIAALGLHRLNESVVQPDSAAVRGMVNKVRHLVKVEVNEA